MESISKYAAGTLLATVFCVCGWTVLAVKNYKRRLNIFGHASLITACAYSIAFFQYVVIFYVDKTVNSVFSMNLLFIREMLHCTAVLIFIYNYNAMPSLRLRRVK